MSRLDDIDAIKSIDRSNMLTSIRDLPDQVATAWKEAKKLTLPSNYIRAENIVILGMGGSGIGGEMAASLAASESEVPIAIVRDYAVPKFVGKNTLAIVCSHSGNTEETIAGLEQAGKRGAKIVTISTGGEVERIGTRFRAPHFLITYGSEARAALGYTYGPILSILARIGAVGVSDRDVEGAVAAMRRVISIVDPEHTTGKNPAKQLASRLKNRIPVAIGAGTLAPLARRFKIMINENAKTTAFSEAIPEWDHNAIAGLPHPRELPERTFYVLFRSRYDHPRNTLRLAFLLEDLARRRIPTETIQFPESKTPIEEQLLCAVFVDFVSFYLAINYGIDPTPTENIVRVKERLARQ